MAAGISTPLRCRLERWEKAGNTYISLVNQQKTCPIYPLGEIWVDLRGQFATVNEVSDSKIRFSTEITANGIKICIEKLAIFALFELS
jgi:hypothetical protein